MMQSKVNEEGDSVINKSPEARSLIERQIKRAEEEEEEENGQKMFKAI